MGREKYQKRRKVIAAPLSWGKGPLSMVEAQGFLGRREEKTYAVTWAS